MSSYHRSIGVDQGQVFLRGVPPVELDVIVVRLEIDDPQAKPSVKEEVSSDCQESIPNWLSQRVGIARDRVNVAAGNRNVATHAGCYTPPYRIHL